MNCLLVHADGRVDDVRLLQREAAAWLGGDVTLVGAVDEARAFAVGLRDAARLPVNTACADAARFDVPVRGPVLFVGTDEDGDETHVDRAKVLACLRK
jgi:hypothetical protein